MAVYWIFRHEEGLDLSPDVPRIDIFILRISSSVGVILTKVEVRSFVQGPTITVLDGSEHSFVDLLHRRCQHYFMLYQ